MSQTLGRPAAAVTWEELLELRKRPRNNISGNVSDTGVAAFGIPGCSGGSADNASCGSAWGEEGEDERARKAPRRTAGFVAELRLGFSGGTGVETLVVEDGRVLAARSPRLRGVLLEEGPADPENALPGPGGPGIGLGPAVRVVDLSGSGLTLRGLRAAVRFAMSPECGPLGPLGLWADTHGITKANTTAAETPIEVALASHGPPGRAVLGTPAGEAQVTEDAIYVFEVLQAATHLVLPHLARAAEDRLLHNGNVNGSVSAGISGGLLTSTTAMPLFARSFTRNSKVSSACLRLIAGECDADGGGVLRGRERQLGVLFATYPIAAGVLCGAFNGLFRSARGCGPAVGSTPDPVLAELLLGPGGATSRGTVAASSTLAT